jgi:integrase/recombinase XerD
VNLEAFLASLRARDRSPRTVGGYRDDLASFARWFEETNGREPEPVAVTPLDVREWKEFLEIRGQSPATINRKLAALRSFFAWAQSQGLVTVTPTQGIRDKRSTPKGPRSLERPAVYALRRAAQERIQLADAKRLPSRMTPTARERRRDKAILHVFLGAGLRVSELCALKLGDLELAPRGGALTVRSGKGDRWREVPLNADVRGALGEWIEVRLAEWGEILFAGRYGKPLRPRGVQRILDRLAKFADVPLEDVSPHLLRHTFAKSLIDAGEPLTKVQALLGHDSVATTTRYTTPTDRDLSAAVARISWSEEA